MTIGAPIVSAWTLSSTPELVQRVETSFLSGLQRGLSTSPSLSQETRTAIANHIVRERPLRLIADALMISYASEWTKRQEAIYGASRVKAVWHGAERLFEPLRDEAPPAIPDFQVKKARFLEDFGHLDLMSRAILEVRLPPESLMNGASHFLTRDMAHLDDGLRPLGIYASNRADLKPEDEIVLRFFSPTVLELGLYVFLGMAAPKLCLAPGALPPPQVHEIHEFGYHPIGLPLHHRKVNGLRLAPLPFVWRELALGAYWATHELP